MISPSNAGSRRSSRTCSRGCQGGCRDCSCRGNERRRGTRCRAALTESRWRRESGMSGLSSLVSLATAHYRLWCRRGFQVTGNTVPDFGFRCPIWRYGALQTCFSAAMRPFHSPWSMGRMDEEMAFTSQSARLRCRSGRSVFCVLSRLATDSGSLSFVPDPPWISRRASFHVSGKRR